MLHGSVTTTVCDAASFSSATDRAVAKLRRRFYYRHTRILFTCLPHTAFLPPPASTPLPTATLFHYA